MRTSIKKMVTMSRFHESIISVLKKAKYPMDVEKIRDEAGIKNWQTAKANLLELMINGSILGQKTSKSWVFWVSGKLHQRLEGGRST